jgi:hypothetical protein
MALRLVERKNIPYRGGRFLFIWVPFGCIKVKNAGGKVDFSAENLLGWYTVRSFANYKQQYGGNKEGLYDKPGADSPFCEGSGTSGEDSDTELPGQAGYLLFWRHTRGTAYIEGYGFATSEGTEGCRTDTRGDRNSQGEILHQQGELDDCKTDVRQILW